MVVLFSFFFFFVPLFLFVSFFKFKHQTWTKTTPINKYKSAWFIAWGRDGGITKKVFGTYKILKLQKAGSE